MTDYSTATHSAVVPEPARKRSPWVRRGAHLVGYTITLLVGVAIGLPSTPAATAPTAPSAATEVPTTVTAPPITVQAAPPATVAPEPVAATSGPATSFGEGMYHAPDEIVPGTYRTPGMAADETYKCMITVDTADGKIADYESTDNGPARVTVAAGQTVTVEGCATLVKVG